MFSRDGIRFIVPIFTTFVALLFVGSPVTAGGYSSAVADPLLASSRVLKFSDRVERTLADAGARVAIVARAGRPEHQMPKGVRYTHVAFAVYSTVYLPDGTSRLGYAMYNLYQRADQPEFSTLVQDYPYDFFAAVPKLTAGIIVPVPRLQRRLLTTIATDRYRKLHNRHYSVIANPYNNHTQNCTEFTLNVLQAAIYKTGDMSYLKSTIREHFSAMPVDISPLKLAAAAALFDSISISDHTGLVETATFGSIERYLDKHGLVTQVLHVNEKP